MVAHLVNSFFVLICIFSGLKEEIIYPATYNCNLLFQEVSSNKPNEIKISGVINTEYWSNVEISHARLYAYIPDVIYEKGSNNTVNILDENNYLNSAIIDSLTIDLDKNQIEILQELITTKNNFRGDDFSLCFVPHHGIVFYNTGNKVVGHISICFECNRYYLSPKTDVMIPMETLKKFIVSAGMPLYESKQFPK